MNGGVAAKFVNTLMGGPAIGPFSYIYVDGQRGYRGIEIITPAENVAHKKVTLAKVTAKNDPPESTRWLLIFNISLAFKSAVAGGPSTCVRL